MKRTLEVWKRPFVGVHHMVVGLGNWAYPQSRESVGIYALDRYVQRYSLSWHFVPNIGCDTLTSKSGVVLVKPRQYEQREMGKAVRLATEAMNLTIDDVTLLHYDVNVPCGQYFFRTGLLDSPNVALESVRKVFDAEALNRVSIGIQQLSEDVFIPTMAQALDKRYFENMKEVWMRNVPNESEQPLVDKACDRAAEELLHSALSSGNTFSRLNTL